MRRSFLFLQGLASQFFARLGRALAAQGHAVHRVNFNGGDRLFWRLPGAVDYRGRLADWPAFLDRLLAERQITDIILFGDSRPVHRTAIPVARARGIAVHVVEEAYLRPGWITFERDGVNANSTLPRDPAWYREQAALLPPWRDAPPLPETLRRRAVEDVAYALARLTTAPLYPHYRTHRQHHPLIEYAGWVCRLALQPWAERRAQAAIAELAEDNGPVFLFPLQLDGDTQIRVHAPEWTMRPTIEHVMRSFARHAPADVRLAVKLHPLDDGLTDWSRVVRRAAVAHGVERRVTIIDGGDIEQVLGLVRGIVTVNSTAGMRALAQGLPVMALGQAIYALPGLTFAGSLDAFWRAPVPSDRELFDAFRRVLAARCMIPGGLFSEAGLAVAVKAAIIRLDAWQPQSAGIAEPAAFVETAAFETATPAE